MSAVKRINEALDSWEAAQNGDGVALFQPRPMDVIELLKQRADLLEALKYCATPLSSPQSPNFFERKDAAQYAIARAEGATK